ncbi:MAG: hypothetical protein ABIJ03_00630 [Patescibacteria group bacterium]
MMIDLTARQVQILRAVIEEFIETAESVGSETIDKKYNIGVSPATIRNEMVALTKQGYLAKHHSSSGRFPTSQAMKLYVNELMKERELTVADEVSAKEKIWQNKQDHSDLLREVIRVLADKSQALGIAMYDNNIFFQAGHSNLLLMPEFFDLDVMRHVFQLIEQTALLEEMFSHNSSENVIQVVYGQELGNKYLLPVGFIHMSFMLDNQLCRVGVLGSNRFDYAYIFPMMKYVRQLVQELA